MCAAVMDQSSNSELGWLIDWLIECLRQWNWILGEGPNRPLWSRRYSKMVLGPIFFVFEQDYADPVDIFNVEFKIFAKWKIDQKSSFFPHQNHFPESSYQVFPTLHDFQHFFRVPLDPRVHNDHIQLQSRLHPRHLAPGQFDDAAVGADGIVDARRGAVNDFLQQKGPVIDHSQLVRVGEQFPGHVTARFGVAHDHAEVGQQRGGQAHRQRRRGAQSRADGNLRHDGHW